MPRHVWTNARRHDRSPLASSLRAGTAPSIAAAVLEFEDDIETQRQAARGARLRREKLAKTKFVSTAGLRNLIDPAIAQFEEAIGGKCFPYNYGPNPAWSGRKLGPEKAAAEIEHFARLGGWIRAAATLPGVRKLLRKNLSTQGMGSPYTRITPEQVMAKFPSPGKFERLLWATKKRAQAILAAYHGDLNPSWLDCASALLVERRVGKAGLIAAACALGFRLDDRSVQVEPGTGTNGGGWRKIPAYRAAREWLVKHRSAAFSTTVVVKKEVWRKKTTETPFQLRPFAELVVGGVEVYQALGVEKWGQRTLAYAVVCGPHSWVADSRSAEEALRYRDFDSEIETHESRLVLPFAFQRLLTQTYEKANALLDAWRNRPIVTWALCANVLFSLGLENPTEVANRVALGALGLGLHEKLEDFSDRAFPITDDSDGVRTYLAAEPELRRVGVSVTRALQIAEDGKRKVIRLVRKGERTYHHSGWGDAQVAVHEAIRAWRRQDELRLVTADLAAFLEGKTTGACPILVRAHSRAAGNCDAGTEQWLRQRGWTNRNSIPGIWLVPHLQDQRVKSVVLQLMRQVGAIRKAA